MKRLVVATANSGKVREIAQLLADLPLEILSLSDFPAASPPEETGATFVENAVAKAVHAAKVTGEMALADDSGIEVDALGGEPGVRSSRFGGPGMTDAGRNGLLLQKLRHIPDQKLTARFRCAAALAWPSGEVRTFEGVCEGRITRGPRGTHGFGYDPIFYLPQYGKTMAELPPEEKNLISHRGRAMSQVKAALRELLGGNAPS